MLNERFVYVLDYLKIKRQHTKQSTDTLTATK